MEGPWEVDFNNSYGRFWFIINRTTGRRKKIGHVAAERTNYYDQAVAECDRRNAALELQGE